MYVLENNLLFHIHFVEISRLKVEDSISQKVL